MKRAGVSILLGPFRDVLPALACVDRLRIERAIHRGHRVGKRVLLTHTAVSPRLTVKVSGKISASDEAAMRRRPKATLMLTDTERDELSTIQSTRRTGRRPVLAQWVWKAHAPLPLRFAPRYFLKCLWCRTSMPIFARQVQARPTSPAMEAEILRRWPARRWIDVQGRQAPYHGEARGGKVWLANGETRCSSAVRASREQMQSRVRAFVNWIKPQRGWIGRRSVRSAATSATTQFSRDRPWRSLRRPSR